MLATRARITAAASFILPVGFGSASDSNSPNWGTLNFGAPDGDRYILATWGSRDDDTEDPFTFASLTIGGVSATLIVEQDGSGASRSCGVSIWRAAVPSGTSGTVSGSLSGFGGTMDINTIQLYRFVDPTNSGVQQSSNSATTSSLDLDTSSGDFALLVAADRTSDPASFSGGGDTIDDWGGSNRTEHGRDRAVLGGASDTYTASSGGDAFAGAVWANP